MKFVKLSVFATLISVSPVNHGAIAAELYNTRPICATPEAVMPNHEILNNEDLDEIWRLNEIRRHGCQLVLRDVLQPGFVKVDVLRCGIRGNTPAQEYWAQVYYPITVDPALPYRICEIEATYSDQSKLRYFTSFINIRWHG